MMKLFQVLDVNKLMRSKFVEAKQKMVEDAKMEATEQAINQVKQQVEAAMLAAKGNYVALISCCPTFSSRIFS